MSSPSGSELVSPQGSLPMQEKGPVPSLYRCHTCRTEQEVVWHGVSGCLFQRRDLYRCAWSDGLWTQRVFVYGVMHTGSRGPCLSVAHTPTSISLLGSHQCRLMVLILCIMLRDQRNQVPRLSYSLSQKEETLFFLEDSWVGARERKGTQDRGGLWLSLWESLLVT